MTDTMKLEFITNNVEKKMIDYPSPFEWREGEWIEEEDLSNGGFGHYIELNSFQKSIVLAINQLLVVNKQILKKYLERSGIMVNDHCLSKELKKLAQNHYLRRYAFHNADGSVALMRIYMVGRKGKGYLVFNKYKMRLEGYIANRNATQIKKILSANQAALGIAGEDNNMVFQTAKSFWYDKRGNGNTNKIFRALAYVTDDKKSYIIQPVRNDMGNISELLDKLSRMEAVLKKLGPNTMHIASDITVVIVAENQSSMEYIKNVLRSKRYSCFRLAVTYDRLIGSEKKLQDKIYYINADPFWKKLFRVS